MFSLFLKKNSKAHENNGNDDISTIDRSNSSQKPKLIIKKTVSEDDLAKDLASLVGEAITIWAKKHGLENLPKDIILDQAISIMITARNSMK